MSELDLSQGCKVLMHTIDPIVVSVPLLELLMIRETAYTAEQTICKAERSLKLLGHQLPRDRELALEARGILRAHLLRVANAQRMTDFPPPDLDTVERSLQDAREGRGSTIDDILDALP